ncbi:MAG: branched-chain amino acid ABC transporter permease, partial [Thermoleophilia bacterium]|nr:branched-chain amino acid ABC transporter permease [Thermoleophilia bacterium]
MANALTATFQRVRGANIIDAVGLTLLVLAVVWAIVKFVEDPSRFLNVAVIGLTNGAIYGVVAIGYTLVYGILQLINFAHGDVFALSGLVASTVILSVLGMDAETGAFFVVVGLAVTLAITVPLFATINATIERIAYKPLRRAPRLAPLITAVGVSFVVQNVSLALYGVDFESVPNFIPRTAAITIGDVVIQWNKLAVFIIVIPVLAALTWFVRSTRQGKAMRAVSQDTDAS